jgi:transposase
MTTLYTHFIGIDIGKLEFVMHIHGTKNTYNYNNDPKGLEMLCFEHSATLPDALVVLETTGGHEKFAIAYLQERNIAVHRAHSRQVKNFIRSYGIVGKSDKIDAMALSLYAAERYEKLMIYEPNKYEHLRELEGRRRDLVAMRTQEKARSKSPSEIVHHQSFAALRQVLDEEIKAIEKQLAALVASDPELQLKVEILQSVPGVGRVTAHSILADMPEIGALNQKQAASLAGVAPHPNQSGLRDGYRKTRGGRRQMRPRLYMAALSASQGNSPLGDFYRRLIANGKSGNCAMVAVMRKIIVIGNARIKHALAAKDGLPSA